MRISLLWTLLLLGTQPLLTDSASAAGGDLLQQGATIYRDFCLRCHGTYISEKPAENYKVEDELIDAVANGGCRVSWGRNFGGKLSPAQLKAVSRYMLHSEETGEEVEPLPKQVHAKASQAVPLKEDNKPKTSRQDAENLEQENDDQLSEALLHLLDKNQIARGAFLYTANCYRCHLSYERAGKPETWRKTGY